MRRMLILGWAAALGLGAGPLAAQESEIELLKRQLKQATESFERALQEQRKIIEDLTRRIEALPERERQAATNVAPATPPRAGEARAPARGPASTPPPALTDPIPVAARGSGYLNVSLDGLFAAGSSTARDVERLQLGGHDPSQRGFTVQNVELVLDGAVDPYFRGQANVIFFLSPEGETEIELEEAYLESLSLPGNLQVKGGQYFTEFGRHNPTHPHTWAFVDTPLVNGRFFGADGLRNPGARVSWLMPAPFYSELFIGVQNSQGETAASFRSGGVDGRGSDDALPFAFRPAGNDRGVRGPGDLLFAPRYALSFDLPRSQTVLLGASAVFGPNSRGGMGGGGSHTRIYGVDLTWKWKSPRHHGGFPFVTWQTEAMLRRYRVGGFDWAGGGNVDADGNTLPDAGVIVDATGLAPAMLPAERLTDYGFYTQLLYGFRKGWVVGLRFDYVTGCLAAYEQAGLLRADNAGAGTPLGRDPLRATRWRLAPNLTWYPSEFSKLRLQYNYDDRAGIGRGHSVWLQFEFLLGAHGAHKF